MTTTVWHRRHKRRVRQERRLDKRDDRREIPSAAVTVGVVMMSLF